MREARCFGYSARRVNSQDQDGPKDAREAEADTSTVSEEQIAIVRRQTWARGQFSESNDDLAVEEPLEIRVANMPLAVVMRTPGHDEELVRGFLVTEGVVRSAGDVLSVRPCLDIDREDAEGNVVNVRLAPHVDLDISRFRRNLYASSSCGVCGKESIERAMRVAAPLSVPPALTPLRVASLPRALRAHQRLFQRTGAVHAAGLVDSTGALVIVREDVGRHNAVDKAVGWFMVQTATREAAALVVSGRVSFEIVQKALAARIPTIVAVSAPTSLAVDLAARSGITLVGFVRDGGFVLYSGELATGSPPAGGATVPFEAS
ncbi:MAG: formate dehydrogenase accessory sulfurtransferase FdhD [Myxococcales bacterium FL481]|nr:MAG: formate dehydrogenase accessory sulfurtransferase FdhD [Myxococcales bacterium FL481]